MFLRSHNSLTRFYVNGVFASVFFRACINSSVGAQARLLCSSNASRLLRATNTVTRRYSRLSDDIKESLLLWTRDELSQIATKQAQTPLPPALNDQVLNKVQVLLLTVNKNEFNATKSLLKPLKGHDSIFTYHHRLDSLHSTDTAIYYLGQYGACAAAISKIEPGSALRTGVSFAPNLAYHCFPNLGAIIGVGVACGVEGKSRMCDVLVSSKVANYDKARIEDGGFTSRGEAIPASGYLQQIFSQSDWPHASKEICKRLSQMSLPELRHGTILSGPFLIDDANFKAHLLQSFAKEAIGIEMEGSGLFAATHQTRTHCILVKSVCDFGDGKKNKILQPTAAVLAADCVRYVLSDPQVPGMLSDQKLVNQHK